MSALTSSQVQPARPYRLARLAAAVIAAALVIACAVGAYLYLSRKALADSHLKTAKAHLVSQDSAAAEHEMLTAITIWPQDAEAYSALADFYRTIGQPRVATTCLLKLRQVSSGYRHIDCRLAVCAEDERSHLEAYALAQEELKKDPNCPRALDLLSTMDQSAGDKQKSNQEAERAYHAAPHDEQAVILYAYTFIPENPGQAIKILQAAQSFLPDSWRVAFLLGRSLGLASTNSQDLSLAETQLRRAETLRSDQAPIHKELSRILLLENHVAEAVEEGSLAVKYGRYNPANYTEYARSLRRAGQQTQADEQERKARKLENLDDRFSQLQEQLKNSPNDPVLIHELASLCEQLDRTSLAIVMVRAALAAHPGNAQLTSDLDRLMKSVLPG